FCSSRRRHTRFSRDWSSDVCSSDLRLVTVEVTLDPAALQRVPDPTQDPLVNVIGPLPRDFVSSIAGWLEVTPDDGDALRVPIQEIGRASCRERVYMCAGGRCVRKNA